LSRSASRSTSGFSKKAQEERCLILTYVPTTNRTLEGKVSALRLLSGRSLVAFDYFFDGRNVGDLEGTTSSVPG